MGEGQLIIKIALIAVLAIVGLLLVVPGRGARGQAIQRLSLLLALFLGVLAVIFPDATTSVANFLGIGRGVDLLFYASIVAAIGYVVTTTLRLRKADRDFTLLARKVALLEANLREGHDTLPEPPASEPIRPQH